MTATDAWPEWKTVVLTAMTLTVVLAAHWHSYRAARADLRRRRPKAAWRVLATSLWRHELHSLRQVPLLVFFVLASVAVVARL